MAAGFADGIKDSIWLVTLKAEAMAQAAVDAAREVLAINSPSRVFYGIGEYAGEGLVDGLEDYAVKVYKTGSGRICNFYQLSTDFFRKRIYLG